MVNFFLTCDLMKRKHVCKEINNILFPNLSDDTMDGALDKLVTGF